MSEEKTEIDSSPRLAELGVISLVIFFPAFSSGRATEGEELNTGLSIWLAEWSGNIDFVPFLFIAAFLAWSAPQWKFESKPSKIAATLAVIVCYGSFLALTTILVLKFEQGGLSLLSFVKFSIGPILIWSLWGIQKIEEPSRTIRLKGITIFVLAALEVPREWFGSVIGPL